MMPICHVINEGLRHHFSLIFYNSLMMPPLVGCKTQMNVPVLTVTVPHLRRKQLCYTPPKEINPEYENWVKVGPYAPCQISSSAMYPSTSNTLLQYKQSNSLWRTCEEYGDPSSRRMLKGSVLIYWSYLFFSISLKVLGLYLKTLCFEHIL